MVLRKFGVNPVKLAAPRMRTGRAASAITGCWPAFARRCSLK